MGQTVKLGRALTQIGVSRTNAKEGWQQKLLEQRSWELYSKTPEITEYYSTPEETERSLQTATLHSGSQNLSSSEIFQLLSVNSISACPGNGGTPDMSKDDKGDSMINLNEEIQQSVDEIKVLLSSGNIRHTRCKKYSTRHPDYLSLGPVAKWLKDRLVNVVGYRRKREDIRLQTSQMHAALSAARLAAAIAGIIGNSPFKSTSLNDISMTDMVKHTDKKMHAAITSAAALVAASCAEAAKSAGASIEQVSSVINMGLDARAMGDLLTLTTSTAACLRGVECLKMRTITNHTLQDHMKSQKGAILPVRTPEGRLHKRMVSVDCDYDNGNVMLTLRKRHCFTPSKKYIIFHEQGEQRDIGYQRDEDGYHTINLLTSGGNIQLLFEEHGEYTSWKSFIDYLIFNQGWKLSH